MSVEVPSWYADAIAGSHSIVERVSIVDRDGNVLQRLDSEDGFVFAGSVTSSRLRLPAGDARLSIANPGGIWTPRTGANDLGIGARIRIERGISAAAGSVLFSIFLGQIENPEAQVSAGASVLVVACKDLWRIFAKKRSRAPIELEEGRGVGDTIRSLAVLAGWPDDDDLFDFDDDRQTIAVSAGYPTYTLLADLMTQVASDYSLWLYPSPDGPLTLEPLPTITDDLTAVATYEPGERSTLLAVTKGLYADDLYNAVDVLGTSSRGSRTYFGSARDMNPDSATYNPPAGFDPDWPDGGGPMGDLLAEPIRSSGIGSDEQAQRRAEAALFAACLFQERHDWSIVNDPARRPGDTVYLGEPNADIAGVQLIDELAQDLSIGEGDDTSRILSKRLRSLIA